MEPLIISWREFVEEDEQSLIEQAALYRRALTSWPPELFELLCADSLWRLSPLAATRHTVAQLEFARKLQEDCNEPDQHPGRGQFDRGGRHLADRQHDPASGVAVVR